MIVLNEFNQSKSTNCIFLLRIYVKSINFLKQMEPGKTPGFESAKPGKLETRVLKYRPGSNTLVKIYILLQAKYQTENYQCNDKNCKMSFTL